MNYNLKFLSLSHRHPRSVGAILPSSPELAANIIAPVDFSKTSVVVELGPGTGPITEEIAVKLSGKTKYVGIERNKDFCTLLKARFPHLTFVHDCAENIPPILTAAGITGGADAVISGLPWLLIPSVQWDAILKSIKQSMRPGAVFIAYTYLSGMLLPVGWKFRRRLQAEFQTVTTTPVVWRNLPPAFAYVCYR